MEETSCLFLVCGSEDTTFLRQIDLIFFVKSFLAAALPWKKAILCLS
jgi:hypothetical protein